MKRSLLIQVYGLVVLIMAVVIFYYDLSTTTKTFLVIGMAALGYSLFKSAKKGD